MTAFDGDRWRITGPLTVREVPQAFAESAAQRDRAGMPAEIDLAGLEGSDSSALALLLEWLSWARRAGAETAFSNPPDGLRVIARLSDADGILGWSEEGTGA